MGRPTGKIPQAENYPYVNDNGLGSLAASCVREGADVTLLGWNYNYSLDLFRQKLLELNPDVVGIKVFTTHFLRAYLTLQVIRDTLPKAIIVIGGPHPSTTPPEHLFLEFKGLIDFAIAGDGENGIVALMRMLGSEKGIENNGELAKIPGLIYKCGERVLSNQPNFDIDLDDLPPIDWSLQKPGWFNTSKNPGVVAAYVDDSRGCPGRCGHCNCPTINGAKPRHRNLDKLLLEINELINEYNVNRIVFTGNSFLSDLDYTRELCDRLAGLKKPITWQGVGGIYADRLADKKLVRLMRRAGCTNIPFGVESGSPKIREIMSYNLSLVQLSEAISATVDAGIRAEGSFMYGFPGETVKDMKETLHFALTSPFSSLSFCLCLPLPSTKCWNWVLREKDLDRIDWKSYDFSNPPFVATGSSMAEVKMMLLLSRFPERSKVARKILKNLPII